MVCIREADEWKTTFNTLVDHYKYLLMPFVLMNTPVVLQALINKVLRGMLIYFTFVYLVDSFIFSKSLKEHAQLVQAVLHTRGELTIFESREV